MLRIRFILKSCFSFTFLEMIWVIWLFDYWLIPARVAVNSSDKKAAKIFHWSLIASGKELLQGNDCHSIRLYFLIDDFVQRFDKFILNLVIPHFQMDSQHLWPFCYSTLLYTYLLTAFYLWFSSAMGELKYLTACMNFNVKIAILHWTWRSLSGEIWRVFAQEEAPGSSNCQLKTGTKTKGTQNLLLIFSSQIRSNRFFFFFSFISFNSSDEILT